MTVKIMKKGHAVVTETHKDKKGMEVEKVHPSESVSNPSPVTSEHPCTVGYHAQMTINLGNYESVRAGVSLSMPCDANKLDETYTTVCTWVDAKMVLLNEDIDSAKGSN